MKHLMAKIMVFVACAVILLHAVMPHRHHDCAEGMGIVFETELCCHCDCAGEHHDAHSHHPFDICLLQEMLSHLVLTSDDDPNALSALIQAEANNFQLLAIVPQQWGLAADLLPEGKVYRPIRAVAMPSASWPSAVGLRAPPAWV